MLYIDLQYCVTTVIYMSQEGLMQAGGVFHCLSGLSCFYFTSCLLLQPTDSLADESESIGTGYIRCVIRRKAQ